MSGRGAANANTYTVPDQAKKARERETASENAVGTKQYNELKKLVQKWAIYVKKLYERKVPAIFQTEKNDLLVRAGNIKKISEKIFGKVDSANEKGLGFVPIVIGVTLVAIAGASAYITHWITDYLQFSKKVDAYEIALKSGQSQQQAMKSADRLSASVDSGGIISNIKKYAPLVGVAIVLMVFKDEIFSRMKNSKGKK